MATTSSAPSTAATAPSAVPSPADALASFRLDGKVAIVTGASSGLGRRFAELLAAVGAQVVAAARRVDRLEELAAATPGVTAMPCDVADDAQVASLVATTVERFGSIDVLVNNAGLGVPHPAEEEPLDWWRQVVDVNLTGLFVLTQAAARHMIAAGHGSVVNVASMLGTVAAAPIKQASYCATKGAVVNLTRELGAQWARKGVRVNALAPGWFPSEMTAEMVADDSSRAFVARNCPMARFGEEHELDGALLFLASDASTYVTGQTLIVDGGWTAR